MARKSAKNDVLATMRERLQMALGALSSSRNDELDDLRFMAGSPDNNWQWPSNVLATRGNVQGQTINARPCLTINKLPQHVRQVTNDQRQNRPSGKVIPADDRADPQVAEIYDGVVRHIEYMSDADVAYDTACENQVTFGEGYWRLLTEYCDENTFDQDIKIERIRNSFSVYMDPTIQDPCGSDAKWCFITQDMTRDEYERLFPDATPITALMDQGTGDSATAQWVKTPSRTNSGQVTISRASESASAGATPTRFIPVSTFMWTGTIFPCSRAAIANNSTATCEVMQTRRS